MVTLQVKCAYVSDMCISSG